MGCSPNSRWLQHTLIAFAVLAAQWVGIAHSIEHRDTLHAELHTEPHFDPHADFLHSCLLFDGVTTAQTAVSAASTNLPTFLLAELPTQRFEPGVPRNTLFTQRVRVRDPPLFS